MSCLRILFFKLFGSYQDIYHIEILRTYIISASMIQKESQNRLDHLKWRLVLEIKISTYGSAYILFFDDFFSRYGWSRRVGWMLKGWRASMVFGDQ